MKKFVRITALFVLLPFTFTNLSFAAEARIMTDHELDQIHAGGLNLDFDKFLGSRATTTDTVSKGGVFDPSSGAGKTFNFSKGKVQIFNIPKTPKTPKTPDAPKMPDMPDFSDAAHNSAVETSTSSSHTSSTTSAPTSTLPDTTTSALTDTASVSTNPVDTSSAAVQTAQTNPVDTTSVASNIATTSTPPTDNVKVTETSVAQNTAAATAQNTSAASQNVPETSATTQTASANVINKPAQPNSPAQPTAPNSPKVPDDMLVLVDTPAGGQMGVVIDGSSLAALQSGKGSANVLNVTDTAQQYLQALANVNAVNSTVPVQINMVVLVNSIVENLNNSNNLNINTPQL